MKAEIISIGDELTSGQRLDTNSPWLAERLGELGIRTLYHTTVADDLAANVLVFRQAIARAEVIVCTGGLGPTADDLTRQALAEATDRELVFDAVALAAIEGLFARRGRTMPERNRVQAFFPAGARIISNPNGTAPGIDLDAPRTAGGTARVFSLPGVPAEMKEMWQQTVQPALRALAGSQTTLHYRVKCFGVGESDLEAMLPDLIRRGRDPQVGITVHQATITLRLTTTGADPAACRARMQPTLATIHECLGELVYGEEDDELQDAVVRLLAEKQKSLATLECGTGGLIANWLSQTAGAADVYRGGSVKPILPARPLAELAAETRAQCAADYVLVTGPFPPVTGATASEQPFEYGVLGPSGWTERAARFAGHPDILRERSGKQALNLLRLILRAARPE